MFFMLHKIKLTQEKLMIQLFGADKLYTAKSKKISVAFFLKSEIKIGNR